MTTQTIPADRANAFERLCDELNRIGRIRGWRIDRRAEWRQDVEDAGRRAYEVARRTGRLTPAIDERIDWFCHIANLSDAAIAVVTKDLIDPSDYLLLTAFWAENVGPVPS